MSIFTSNSTNEPTVEAKGAETERVSQTIAFVRHLATARADQARLWAFDHLVAAAVGALAVTAVVGLVLTSSALLVIGLATMTAKLTQLEFGAAGGLVGLVLLTFVLVAAFAVVRGLRARWLKQLEAKYEDLRTREHSCAGRDIDSTN